MAKPIKAPHYAKDAVIDPKGWRCVKTGELLAARKFSADDIKEYNATRGIPAAVEPEPAPVVEPTPEPVAEEVITADVKPKPVVEAKTADIDPETEVEAKEVKEEVKPTPKKAPAKKKATTKKKSTSKK